MIVSNNLLRTVDADTAEQRSGRLRRGKRMTTVDAILRAGEIAVDVQKGRAGYVRLPVFVGAPPFGLHQIVPNVKKRERRIGQALGELIG